MANGKYYIEPGFNIGQGLMGLGQQLGQAHINRQKMDVIRKQQQIAEENRKRQVIIDTIYKGLANPADIPQLAESIGAPEIALQYENDPEGTTLRLKRMAAGLDPQRFKAYRDSLMSGEGPDGVKIGAQVILPDSGVIIQSTNKGPRVWGPGGKQLVGDDAKKAIEEARQKKIDTAEIMAGRKKTATLEAEKQLKPEIEAGIISSKEAAKIASNSFDQLKKVYDSIDNINDAIAAIDKGASTGPIVSMFPSFRQASQELDAVQKRMGLDVIGSTTFGALSEGELKLALSTAMPTNMQPKELKKWLINKRDAQQKLSKYIQDASIYLGTPGNTVSDWMKIKRESMIKPIGGNLQDTPSEDIKNQLKDFGFNF